MTMNTGRMKNTKFGVFRMNVVVSSWNIDTVGVDDDHDIMIN